MNLDTVRALVRLMEESSLTAMEVQDESLRVRLENSGAGRGPLDERGAGAPAGTAVGQGQPAAVEPPAQSAPVAAEEAASAAGEPPAGKQLLSPMVGTFHELPEGRRVAVGAQLQKGDPICIVEAMKVMNEIAMEESGVISYIAAKEGDMVEYGQVLYVFD